MGPLCPKSASRSSANHSSRGSLLHGRYWPQLWLCPRCGVATNHGQTRQRKQRNNQVGWLSSRRRAARPTRWRSHSRSQWGNLRIINPVLTNTTHNPCSGRSGNWGAVPIRALAQSSPASQPAKLLTSSRVWEHKHWTKCIGRAVSDWHHTHIANLAGQPGTQEPVRDPIRKHDVWHDLVSRIVAGIVEGKGPAVGTMSWFEPGSTQVYAASYHCQTGATSHSPQPIWTLGPSTPHVAAYILIWPSGHAHSRLLAGWYAVLHPIYHQLKEEAPNQSLHRGSIGGRDSHCRAGLFTAPSSRQVPEICQVFWADRSNQREMEYDWLPNCFPLSVAPSRQPSTMSWDRAVCIGCAW